LAARKRQPPVETPERGKPRWGKRVAKSVRRSPESHSRLRDVVLKEPGLGQGGTNAQLVLAGERIPTLQLGQELRGFCAAASFEGRICSGECGLNRSRDHAGEYTRY